MTAFSCGVILLYRVGVILPLYTLIGGILALILLSRVTSAKTWRQSTLFLVFALVGASWTTLFAGDRLARTLPQELEGRQVEVDGYLCDIPARGNYQSVRFSLCVTAWPGEIHGAGQESLRPEKLRLAWYGDKATLDLPHQLRATVVLKRPHGALNPQGFRYETWLFREGYGATGTVRQIQPQGVMDCGMRCHYHQWRNQWAAALHQRLANTSYHGLAEALLMGNRGWIEPSQWQVFQGTGTIHLVAISGLHLGLIALAVAVVVHWMLLRLPPGWLTPVRQRLLTTGLVLCACLLYALLAGFTVPTRRALIMVAVASWLALRARQTSVWGGWLFALFLVLLMDPFAPLDRGFWLSFGAVAVLILVFSRWVGRCHWSVALVLAQAAVFVGLWPLLAVMGQPQVTMGVLANLVAVPWVSLVVMPVLLLGGMLLAAFPGTTDAVGWGYDLVLGALWHTLSPLAAWSAPIPATGLLIPVTLAVAVLLAMLFPDRQARWLAVGVCGLWLFRSLAGFVDPDDTSARVAEPEIWVWDVGQGLSVLIRHEDQVLVYDTGPSSPQGYSAVERVLLPNYAGLGVARIDALVVSHGDSDHAGGLPLLLAAMPVAVMASGEPERIRRRLAEDLDRSLPVVGCNAVDGMLVGQLLVTAWQARDTSGAESNDRSCVLSVRFAGVEVILPGDISEQVERGFLAEHGVGPVDYRVVVAPHHGSKTSSGEDWVAALAPDLVIFSAGYRHRFGHPHRTVTERYRQGGSRLLNTADSGAIRLGLGETAVDISTARENQPFWILPPEL